MKELLEVVLLFCVYVVKNVNIFWIDWFMLKIGLNCSKIVNR